MKKLFIVLAIASIGFASCGNEGDKKPATDTPAAKVDSPAVTTPKVDSPAAPKMDSPAVKVDSPAKKK